MSESHDYTQYFDEDGESLIGGRLEKLVYCTECDWSVRRSHEHHARAEVKRHEEKTGHEAMFEHDPVMEGDGGE